MDGRFDSRNALVALVDEVSRLNGRLKSVFAMTRREVGLGESEMMVLNAVVEAEHPPTVSQIGRSLGTPRQLVQRATYALTAEALIETWPNPDHKRAVLLVPTAEGRALKQRADRVADRIAADLARDLDMTATASAVQSLRGVRKALETQLRKGRG